VSFANDLWDSFEAVSKNNKRGAAFTSKLQTFLSELVKLESEYAKGVAKLCSDKAFAGEPEFGELQALWETLKNETNNAGAAHLALGEQLNILATATGDSLKERKKRSKVVSFHLFIFSLFLIFFFLIFFFLLVFSFLSTTKKKTFFFFFFFHF
jgi:hypothetical protein